MSERENAVLQELGETINAAAPEDQSIMAAMIAAFRAGVDIGEKRAAS